MKRRSLLMAFVAAALPAAISEKAATGAGGLTKADVRRIVEKLAPSVVVTSLLAGEATGVTTSINGLLYQIPLGRKVRIPTPVREILEASGWYKVEDAS